MDILSIFFNIKVRCVFSLESPHRGDSNEYTKYTIFNIKKKIALNYPKSAAMAFFLSKGLKNEFETALVDEPSVFEPLKFYCIWGWSGGAMVLGKLPVPGRPTSWIIVGQGPTPLAVGAGGGCLDIFTLLYPFSPLSPSLWETARYRLKYCLKEPLNPKQPTNQIYCI